MIDVRMFTVGPVQENCFIVREQGRDERGDRRSRRRARPAARGDRRARDRRRSRRSWSPTPTSTTSARSRRSRAATGRPSTARSSSARCWPTSWTSSRGRASARSRATRPTTPSRGGETLELAGLDDRRDLHARPQPRATSPTRSADEDALFSGDVLFQGSVGRVDLPGGDWPTLLRIDRDAARRLPAETTVYPGPHGDHDARARARDQPVPARARRQR